MARQYYLNGETLVLVTNPVVGSSSQLGLSDTSISVSVRTVHDDIKVDAWGANVPEEQWMGGSAMINMTLVHYDPTVLNACVAESMCGGAFGQVGRAGQLQGGQVALQSAGNHYIQLTLTSPVAGKAWTFPAAHLLGTPIVMPLGVERSVVRMDWRAIAYTTDPYGGGTGSQNAVLWTWG